MQPTSFNPTNTSGQTYYRRDYPEMLRMALRRIERREDKLDQAEGRDAQAPRSASRRPWSPAAPT